VLIVRTSVMDVQRAEREMTWGEIIDDEDELDRHERERRRGRVA
jgi:hypothetical protein